MDGESGNRFHRAASDATNNLAGGAVFRAQQIITSKDAGAAYDREFITALALLSEDEAFDIRRILKDKLGRDFNTKEFDRRLKQERERLTPPPEYGDWEAELLRTNLGSPRACLANGITAFRKHPSWQGVLAFDEFALHTLKRKPTPWEKPNFSPRPWMDNDDREAANWLQHGGIMVNTGTASESAETVAYDSAFHPVREYLNSLEWDEQPRVQTWLSKYIGTVDGEYERQVGTKWLISAVARVMEPGCQVDHTLVFEGKQGKRKSTALRTLGSPWFIDHLPDLSKPDASASLCGVWIVEMGELASLRKTSNIESVKEFLTRQTDRFRPPYGRRTKEVPRQCVFSASTNRDTWNADETGGRRFWPVRCGFIDIKSLRADRDQLWAEALHLYRSGVKWWIEDDSITNLATDQQEERFELDPWDEIVMRWAEGEPPKAADRRVDNKTGSFIGPEPPEMISKTNKISILDVLIHAIGKPQDRLTHWDHVRVGNILTHHGWKKFQEKGRSDEDSAAKKRRPWFYRNPNWTPDA